jgi:hypothetical protein
MKKISLRDVDESSLREIGSLPPVDMTLPLPERLEIIAKKMGNPYRYLSSDGLKVKINHANEKTLDDALFEHFNNQCNR